MTAAALLREAAQAGVTVRLAEGKPKVAGNPPPELLARLRENKAAIVTILIGDACRWCGEILRWPRPAGIIFADGLASACRVLSRGRPHLARRGAVTIESPDALSDPAEVMLRGEIT